jgi:hypothetical protein
MAVRPFLQFFDHGVLTIALIQREVALRITW